MEDVIFIAIVIGLIVLTIVIFLSLEKRRKRAITEEGKSFGFHRLAQEETLPVAEVPLFTTLIDTDLTEFSIILRGEINGYEAGFFDLIMHLQKSLYHSIVIVKNPQVMMPKFQLKSLESSFWFLMELFSLFSLDLGWLRQHTHGDELKIPGREEDMGSLRLSADDSQWAFQTFSRATPQFFQKLQKGKWTIEGFQDSLVIYRWCKRIPARKLQEYVRQAAEISAEMYSICS